MKFRTAELTGKALDYAVEMAQGFTFQRGMPEGEWSADPDCRVGVWRKSPADGHWCCMRCAEGGSPSTQWEYGGPILDNTRVELLDDDPYWLARLGSWREIVASGPTRLVAGMRCIVMKELGDEVDIPDDLLI